MTRREHEGKTKRTWAGSSAARFLRVAIAALAVTALHARAQHGPTAGSTAVQPTRPTEILDPLRPVPAYPAAAPCGDESEKMKEVRGTGSGEVDVSCSLTLPARTTITKKIVYRGSAASGATLNCTCDQSDCTTLRGGILILSPSGLGRPENITVRNCKITGDVKLNVPSFTYCPEGITSLCRDKQPGFDEWVRARAPRRITFDNVTIAGSGRDRFYVGWGVTETKLINSVIEGEAWGVPIYLAPHSSRTLLKNNQIRTVTTAPGLFRTNERESISIDGSDHNQIISNWFGALNRGGMFVYRNCGENGSIRQTTPSYNHIINNVFYYNNYDGPKPAVYLGSRNGNPPGFEIGRWGSYCDDDEGYPYGSSADDRDFATHNVVMQNEIVKRPVADVIKSLDWVNNAMNLVDGNQTVTKGKWPRPPAGCYVRGGEKEFILNGETTEKFMGDDGSPNCGKVTCHDGELRRALAEHHVVPSSVVATPSSGPAATTIAPPTAVPSTDEPGASFCRTRRVPIDCQINGENKGCQQTVSCPAGTKVVGAVAACNLENGAVTDAELATVPPHFIHVARLSDHVPSGSCFVEGNAVIGKIVNPSGGGIFGAARTRNVPQSAVQTSIRGIAGRTRVAVGCKEYDKNGGDCHIRGWLYCR
ncbi:MAG: right-handed parallel beta-helix repeat-containing protein [Steroidobacteraceae bacterium]|nr:right-handed parallel beta-helix repeat-containing protein [Steroidobacteraceae bacterium]